MAKILGTSGDDHLVGTAGADTFDLTAGGTDAARGESGGDLFLLGDSLDANDRIFGGAGIDTVLLDGNYRTQLVLAPDTFRSIEVLKLAANFDYNIKTGDATVADGKTLTVDGSTLGAADMMKFDGSAETNGRFAIFGGGSPDTLIGGAGDDRISGGGGPDTLIGGAGDDRISGGGNRDILIGGAGDDRIIGGDGNDVIDLTHGGDDNVHGDDGDDTFLFGSNFTPNDHVDGGGGDDVAVLDGDYSAGVRLTKGVLPNVEVLKLTAGHDYSFVVPNDFQNANSPTHVTIDGSSLGVGDVLTFDGRQTSDASGNLHVTGGAGDDVIISGPVVSIFDLRYGGNDTAIDTNTDNNIASHRAATFLLGGSFGAGDHIVGSGPDDTVVLHGDYSAGLTITNAMLSHVVYMQLDKGFSYNLTLDQSSIRSIFAQELTAANALTIDLSHEHASQEVYVHSGSGDDVFHAGNGLDAFDGGSGHDTFVYTDVAQSFSGAALDEIEFDAGSDHFDLPVSVTGIDPAVRIDYTHINASKLQAHHAVISYYGTYDVLVVDANGVAGFQQGQDFAFRLLNAPGTTVIHTGDFI